jgi:hypothetical protein
MRQRRELGTIWVFRIKRVTATKALEWCEKLTGEEGHIVVLSQLLGNGLRHFVWLLVVSPAAAAAALTTTAAAAAVQAEAVKQQAGHQQPNLTALHLNAAAPVVLSTATAAAAAAAAVQG